MQPRHTDSDYVRLAVHNLIADSAIPAIPAKAPRRHGRWILLASAICINGVFVGAVAMLSAQSPIAAALLGSGSGAIVGLFVSLAQSLS